MQEDAFDGRRGMPADLLMAALHASGVVGTWSWDIPRNAVRYDAGAAAFLAGDPDLAGQDLTAPEAVAAIHPDDVAWVMVEMERCAATGGLVLAEYRVVPPGRGTRWVLSRGRTVQDADGRPLRAYGILIDITDSHGSEPRYVTRAPDPHESPAERAAALGLALRETLGAGMPTKLRLLLDMVLMEIGRELGGQAGAHRPDRSLPN